MEEKRSKVNIVLAVLFVLAIITICVMAIYINKLSSEKEKISAKADSLNANVNNLENTVSDLQEKIDNVSNAINTDKTQEKSEDNSSKLSDEEATKLLKEKFENVEKIYLEPNKIFNTKSNNEISNFEETLQKYGTENFVTKVKSNLPMVIEMKNNKYYITNGGGSREYNGLDGFENVKVSDNSITATLKTKQTGPDASGNWIDKEDKKSEIKLVKNGNTWLIDEINTTDLN